MVGGFRRTMQENKERMLVGHACTTSSGTSCASSCFWARARAHFSVCVGVYVLLVYVCVCSVCCVHYLTLIKTSIQYGRVSHHWVVGSLRLKCFRLHINAMVHRLDFRKGCHKKKKAVPFTLRYISIANHCASFQSMQIASNVCVFVYMVQMVCNSLMQAYRFERGKKNGINQQRRSLGDGFFRRFWWFCTISKVYFFVVVGGILKKSCLMIGSVVIRHGLFLLLNKKK